MFPGPILREALQALEDGVQKLTRNLQRPLYLGQPHRGEFRYANRNSQLMQILKAVRVVSGLHAAIQIGRMGFHQEAGAILRVVDEALQDIDVLDEAHFSKTGPTTSQQQLVNEFFSSDDVQRMESMLAGQAQPVPRVSRKKKRAAIERRLSAVPSPSPIRPTLDTIDAVLDGYVHCGYAQIMELYSASPTSEGFHMRGVHDQGRQELFASWVPLFVHHALNSVAHLLLVAKLHAEADELVELRKRLETSQEYP